MIFKDFIVIDNVFKSPDQLVTDSKSVKYFSNMVTKKKLNGLNMFKKNNEDISLWRGYRSEILDNNTYVNSEKVFGELFNKIFGLNKNTSFNLFFKAFFHYSTEEIVFDENWWHKDESLLSGVVYLNKEPPPRSGTILKINNKNVEIENKYNRCVFYKADITHRPASCFGFNSKDARLTLTFFIPELTFFYAN